MSGPVRHLALPPAVGTLLDGVSVLVTTDTAEEVSGILTIKKKDALLSEVKKELIMIYQNQESIAFALK